MGMFTENGLMKVAEFEKVSFDQFVQDWEKQMVRYPEESIYGGLKLPCRKTVDSADMTSLVQQILQFVQETHELFLQESDVRLKKDGCY